MFYLRPLCVLACVGDVFCLICIYTFLFPAALCAILLFTSSGKP